MTALLDVRFSVVGGNIHTVAWFSPRWGIFFFFVPAHSPGGDPPPGGSAFFLPQAHTYHRYRQDLRTSVQGEEVGAWGSLAGGAASSETTKKKGSNRRCTRNRLSHDYGAGVFFF